MADSPSRPKRPTAARALSSEQVRYLQTLVSDPNVQLGVIGETRYNKLRTTKIRSIDLFGGCNVAIWAGLLSIAFFGDETGQQEFLVLGFGGLLDS